MESLCGLLCRASGGRVITSEKGYYGWDSPCSAWYSRYNFDNVPPALCGSAIGEIRKNHVQGKPVFIYYTEEVLGQDISQVLASEGFHCMSVQTGMACEIAGERTSSGDAVNPQGTGGVAANPQGTGGAAANPQGIGGAAGESIRIADSTEIEAWSAVNATAFGKPDEAGAFKVLYETRECDFYAYMIEGRIAATAMLHKDPKNAGIHEVSTLPQFQGRGIGSAVVARMLSDARDCGLGLITLQASQAGVGLYEKAGFKRLSQIKTWVSFQ